MKSFILTIILFSTLVSNSQVRGIGKLKLGADISIMCEIAALFDSTAPCEFPSTYGSYQDYDRSTTESYTKIVELVQDTINFTDNYSGTHADPRSRTFFVLYYPLTNNIKISNITLSFFNDTLVNIQCDYNKDLDDALDLKYGISNKSVKKTPHTFTRTYTGTTITLTDERVTSTWKTTANIMCVSLVEKYYSESIDPKYISSFVLGYTNIKYNDELIRLRYEKRKKEEKEKELEGF